MKKLNQKEWARLQSLNAQLTEHFNDPMRQSVNVWRGDFRAIQWACWWIREHVAQSAPPGAPVQTKESSR